MRALTTPRRLTRYVQRVRKEVYVVTMRGTWDMQRLSDVRGKDVFSSDGEKIGSVKEIYYNDTQATPEWIGLGTGFLGMKERVIPVETLSHRGEDLYVPYTKDKVQNAPEFEKDGEIIRDTDEDRLCSYFNLTEPRHSTRVLRPDENYRGPML
jgi:sporulation protein YlmC with PRC-barrel domain